MRLQPMRYKDYTWPHNPETYTVEYRRQVVAHKVPMGGWVLQDLGETQRILQGEGTFAGETAYEDFQALAQVFFQEGPGLLVHPVWQGISAYFVSLELAEEPLPDYVRYRFVFWEDSRPVKTGLTELPAEEAAGGQQDAAAAPAAGRHVHVVKNGDTLWGLAQSYGVSLTEIIRANPQIKNPNLIYPGNQVIIP